MSSIYNRKITIDVPLTLQVQYGMDARGGILPLTIRLAGNGANLSDVLYGEDYLAAVADIVADIEGYEADMRAEVLARLEKQTDEVCDAGVKPL